MNVRAAARHCLLPLLLAACASGPPKIAPDAEPVLAEAEAMLSAGNAEASADLLEGRDKATFPRRLQDRYVLCLARAKRAQDDLWGAFETLRSFADDYPHSELRNEVIALEWDLGRTMARSDRGFLFFWSERSGGRTCLTHLITRYPDNAYFADALRVLGDMAFVDEDWSLAQERYRDLLKRHPESEWAPYARFRFAMSIVASLRGAEYDLEQMQTAHKELDAYLQSKIENPEFLAQATAARIRLLDWQAERYLKVARFYRTIGNQKGYVQQLQKACAEPFASTVAGTEAKDLLAAATAPGTGKP